MAARRVIHRWMMARGSWTTSPTTREKRQRTNPNPIKRPRRSRIRRPRRAGWNRPERRRSTPCNRKPFQVVSKEQGTSPANSSSREVKPGLYQESRKLSRQELFSYWPPTEKEPRVAVNLKEEHFRWQSTL